MNYGFFEILSLIGSLGLFLFGMKLMSDSLQKVAGDKMRNILAKMTSNRIKGALTGVLITAVIQSSSATTVMIVSFVNAGLLTLTESIGVIMGANIGTTVTAWIISILGFKISMSAFSLPLIALSLPLLFSRKSSRHSWGELMIGFSILFLGLEFLKTSMPKVDSNVLGFLSNYIDMGYMSVIIFVIIGALMTLIIQSSSAAMALTLVMCNEGLIPFDMAAAMVLGQNIGTTITANLAALVANISAKRTAMAHLLFNVIGVILTMIFFYPILHGIDYVVVKYGGLSAFNSANPEVVPITLSIFHTSFNVMNTILLIGFAPVIEKIVVKIISSKKKEKFRLKHIEAGYYSTSELSIIQAKNEIVIYAERSKIMLKFIHQLINETEDDKFENVHNDIEKYEKIADNMEIEISEYLAKLSEGELSLHGSTRIRAMNKIIDNIESVFDAANNIGRSLKRKRGEKIWFTQDIRDNLNKMVNYLDTALDVMINNLSNEYHNIVIDKAEEAERKINELRDSLKISNREDFKQGEYKYKASVIYNDISSYFETMGDHIINVSEAIEICKE